MPPFQKVLVVDDGAREADRALSAQLAEYGLSSITASLDATEDLLDVIPLPSAIMLHVPCASAGPEARREFLARAQSIRLKASGVPVILVDDAIVATSGACARLLAAQFPGTVLSKPDY
jgi:hypothetical protein